MIGRSQHHLAVLAGLVGGALLSAAAWGQSPPVVVDDQYVVNVNASLNVAAAAGLLANDTGFDPASHRLEAADVRSQYGAAVSVAANGSFSYVPLPGFRGLDSFAYTVRNAFGATTALVQIDVSGSRVWFVDRNTGNNGNGSQAQPFNNFAPVSGLLGNFDVDGPGDIIFVRSGTYNNTDFDLEAGQQLVGEGSGLDLAGSSTDIPPGVPPLLTSTSSVQPIIDCFGAGGQVRGFALSNTAGRALRAQSVADLQLRDLVVNLHVTGGAAIDLFSTSGTQRMENVQITGASPTNIAALAITGNTGTLDVVGSTINVSSGGGRPLAIANNSGTVRFDAASTIAGTATRGLFVNLSSATSQITLGPVQLSGGLGGEPLVWLLDNDPQSSIDFIGGIQLSNTDTNGTGMRMNRGKLRVGGSDSFIEASDGEAIHLDGVQLLSELTFSRISSTGSPHTGMRFNTMVGTVAGTFGVRVTGDTVLSQPVVYGLDIFNNPQFPVVLNKLTTTGGQIGVNVFNGKLTITDPSSTVTTTAGIGLRLISGTLDMQLADVSTAGAGPGIFLDNSTGTLAIAGGTLTSANNQTVLRVNNSNVVLTYGGALNKSEAGIPVHVSGLPTGGSVTLNTVTAVPPASPLLLTGIAGTLRFGTLNLGAVSARYNTSPITANDIAGQLDLGLLTSYSVGAPALNIAFNNTAPGLVRTTAGSVLDTTGPAAALVVNPTSPVSTVTQPLDLHFASIMAPDDGQYGLYAGRGAGTLEVTGLSRFGPKTLAGISLSGTNFNASFKQVEVNGAMDGVHLASMLGNSSFRILGDGSTSTHTDGAGGSFTNLGESAFQFVDVTNVVVGDVQINRTGSHAITATRLRDAEFANVDIVNAGNADNEHGYDFGEGSTSGAAALGTLSIHDGEIRQFAKNGIFLRNWSDALVLKIDRNAIDDNLGDAACGPFNCGGNGIILSADGTAQITARVSGNQIEDIDFTGLYGEVRGNLSARMDLTVAQNQISARPYTGAFQSDDGVSGMRLIAGGGNARLRAAVNDNTFRHFPGVANAQFAVVDLRNENNSLGLDAVLTGNRVEHAHVGNAYRLYATGIGLLRAQLDNNVGPPTGSLGEEALLMRGAFSGEGRYSLLLRGNQFSGVPALANAHTVQMFVTDQQAACADITGNTIAAPSSGTGRSLFYSQTGPAPITLQGMSGSGSLAAQSYLSANNTLGGTPFVANSVSAGTCAAPTPPATVP